jgi:GT2 family glycosyltransferase
MSRTKISVAIPYRRRLQNLALAFEGLARQTLHADEFEVVVGAMEYCPDYLSLCRSYSERLDIVSVVSGADFEISRARNLAMRQARGEVCVQMDADTLLTPDALENLYDRRFRFGQDICVVGQVLGYDNNTGGDITSVDTRSFDVHAARLQDLARAAPSDPRFQTPHIVPWAFAWTGLIALRTDTVRSHDLYFDEDFRGWGVDDLEWGLRISATGTPIVLCSDLCALHLPHARSAAANQAASRRNFRQLLLKWPRPDVELVAAFDDFVANDDFLRYCRELNAAAGPGASGLASVTGSIGGQPAVLIGVPVDGDRRILDPDVIARFDPGTPVEILHLAGLALPFSDDTFSTAEILAPATRLSAHFFDVIQAEVHRVAHHVSTPELTGAHHERTDGRA